MPIDMGDPGSENGAMGGAPPPGDPGIQMQGLAPGVAGNGGRERVFLVVVDDTAEWQSALRFACRRAAHTGGRLALLAIIEPVGFQHWMAVEEKMRAEIREEVERRLNSIAEEVQATIGRYPIIHIREGKPTEELIGLIEEEPSISVLVLAARGGGDGPGPLISYVTGKGIGRMRVPMTIVPATLADDAIDALA